MRNIVERCVDWLKEFRKTGTRFDKLAVNFLAIVELAMIKRYLRKTGFSDRAWGLAVFAVARRSGCVYIVSSGFRPARGQLS